jgi:PAS domain S-box-containing protein
MRRTTMHLLPAHSAHGYAAQPAGIRHVAQSSDSRGGEVIDAKSPRGQGVLDLIHESLLLLDLDGRITDINRASETLYGWTCAQAVGHLAGELLQSGAAQTDGDPAERLQRTGSWEGELHRRTANGDELIIDVRWTLERDVTGQAVGIVETGRDITARRRAEQALGESELRYQNLFHAMAASFWELDFSAVGPMLKALRASGPIDLRRYFCEHPEFVREMMRVTRVSRVNEQTIALFGAGDPAALAGSVEPFWPVESSQVFADSVIAAVTQAPSHFAETRLQTIDGRPLDVLFTACFTAEAVRKGLLLVGILDISERVAARAAMERMQADLAHASRVSMLGELTASIAHEINQPLAAIATNAEAGLRWLRRAEPDIEEVNALTSCIVADARRAADIIDRIRSMAVRGSPQRVPLQINDVIDEALRLLRHEFTAQGIQLRVDAAADLPPIHADRVQLQQVLVNLCVNALQAMTKADTPQRALRLRSCRSEAHDGIQIQVEDSGPGVPSERRQQVFDPLFTTRPGGMGMGLRICRSIIEAHGGTIHVSACSEGQGAVFCFDLPMGVATHTMGVATHISA